MDHCGCSIGITISNYNMLPRKISVSLLHSQRSEGSSYELNVRSTRYLTR